MVQIFKIALIIIGFMVGSFEDLGSLEKGYSKVDSTSFRLAVIMNQPENKLDLKNALFYSFLKRRNFHLNKKKYITRIILIG